MLFGAKTTATILARVAAFVAYTDGVQTSEAACRAITLAPSVAM